MMSEQEARSVLHVKTSSSFEDIEKSYEELAAKWHPDKWTESTTKEKERAERKLVEVQRAFISLKEKSEEQKRQEKEKHKQKKEKEKEQVFVDETTTEEEWFRNKIKLSLNTIETTDNTNKARHACDDLCEIVSVSARQAEVAGELGSVPVIMNALEKMSKEPKFIKSACKLIACMIREADTQNQQLFASVECVPRLSKLLEIEESPKKYICTALHNLFSDPSHQHQSLDCPIIPQLLDLLTNEDIQVVNAACGSLHNVSCDNIETQQVCIDKDSIPKLLSIIQSFTKELYSSSSRHEEIDQDRVDIVIPTLTYAVACLQNLTSGNWVGRKTFFEKKGTKIISYTIKKSPDVSTIRGCVGVFLNVCTGLASVNKAEKISETTENLKSLITSLVSCLKSEDLRTFIWSCSALESLCRVKKEYAGMIAEENALQHLSKIISESPLRDKRGKAAASTMRDILYYNPDNLQYVTANSLQEHIKSKLGQGDACAKYCSDILTIIDCLKNNKPLPVIVSSEDLSPAGRTPVVAAVPVEESTRTQPEFKIPMPGARRKSFLTRDILKTPRKWASALTSRSSKGDDS